MWYTKDYKLVKKSDPGRRRSLAPAFVLFYRRCLTTNSIANRMPRLLAMLFVLLGLGAFYTIATGGIQFRSIPWIIKEFCRKDKKAEASRDHKGNV